MLVNRKAHRLKENKTSPFPRNMIFFDVESELIESAGKTLHFPYLIYAMSYYQQRTGKPTEEEKHFTDTETFWQWVMGKVNRREALYLFAHNPTYDLVSSKGIPYLLNYGYILTSFYNKGRTFILSFRNDDKKCSIHILNVGNYYPGTVKQIGDSFNLPKLELDFKNPTIEQALPYCKRDVEIIRKAMLTWFQFCRDNDLGSFGKTFPKQAINCYRHRFMTNPIFIHNHQEACDLERDSYYGGRTESFYINQTINQEVYYLDVNSMYPYCMKEYHYPNKLITYRDNLGKEGLKYILKNRSVCSTVTLNTNQNCFPCRLANRLIFPIGNFQTTLTTEELKQAFTYNCIENVKITSIYEQTDLFTEFIDYFYNARLKARAEGNKVNDLFFKLFMNSLYGKFGQKSGGWIIEGTAKPEETGYYTWYDDEEGKLYTSKAFAGKLITKHDDKEAYDSFPAISAHITANSRLTLWYYIQRAKPENVYYTDTDSLMVNKEGYSNLESEIQPNVLGKLKLEKILTDLHIFAPKDYEHTKGIARKGIPKEHEKLQPNVFSYTQWPKLNTLIRQDSISQYYTFIQRKTLKRQYLKGWVISSGEVKPFEMTMTEGQNRIVNWKDTSYHQKGMSLQNNSQTEWVSEAFKEAYLPYH